MSKVVKIKSPKLEERRKQIPIETRLMVLYQIAWMDVRIVPSRYPTDRELREGEGWSKKMVKLTMKYFKEWERDGRPK